MSDFKSHFLDLVKPENRNNITVFDIGAYDGTDSLIFHNQFKCNTVVAFEASFRNFNMLKSNIVNTSIQAYNIAISDINGEKTFYDTHGELWAAGSLLKPTAKLLYEHDAFKNNKSFFDNAGYTVKTIRLDTFICTTNIIPNILHIDVQGAEYYVVSSLGNYRPDLIYLETSETEHYQESKPMEDLNKLLFSMGYELHTKLTWDNLYKIKI